MSYYTIWGLFGPATWPWWCSGLAMVCLLMGPKGRRASRWLLATGLVIFLLLAVLPMGYWLNEALEQRFPQSSLDGEEVRHIVVLAGAERLPAAARRGRPEYNSAADRVIEGVTLARRFPRAELWIVGGVRPPHSKIADIEWTSLTWRTLGVPAARIRKIDNTLDTCRNAEGFAAQGTRGTAVLVTSAAHMPRAVACFRAFGVEAIPHPVDYQNQTIVTWADQFSVNLLGNIVRTDTALHEWIGLGVYRVTGRTGELLPAP